MTSSPGRPRAMSSLVSVQHPSDWARLFGVEPSDPVWLKLWVRTMSVVCLDATVSSTGSTLSVLMPSAVRAVEISVSAEATAAEALNGFTAGLAGGALGGAGELGGVVGGVVVGGTLVGGD